MSGVEWIGGYTSGVECSEVGVSHHYLLQEMQQLIVRVNQLERENEYLKNTTVLKDDRY